MIAGAALFRDVSNDTVHYAERFEGVRHRGLRQAFQALNPGLLICHPETFHVLYANRKAREILELQADAVPCRLPEGLVMRRQEEFCEAERRTVACYNADLDNDAYDVRALPVYDAAGKVESVMVVIRDYNDVSWSLFEMLDRLPIAVAAVDNEDGNVRYLNRRALREIYAQRAQPRLKRNRPVEVDRLVEESIAAWIAQGPEGKVGTTELQVGKNLVDMHFADLGEENSTLIYWDARPALPIRH